LGSVHLPYSGTSRIALAPRGRRGRSAGQSRPSPGPGDGRPPGAERAAATHQNEHSAAPPACVRAGGLLACSPHMPEMSVSHWRILVHPLRMARVTSLPHGILER
jgi:hypothetical protein